MQTNPASAIAREALLAAVVDSMGEAVNAVDLDGTILSWNRAAERLYGYTEAEAVGASIHLLVPDDRRAEVAATLARLIHGEPSVSLETVRVAKDGTRVDVSVIVSAVCDADGTVLAACSVARDIREKKDSERRLQISEARYRSIVETSSEGVWTCDAQVRTTFVNRRMAEMLGYAPEEMLGRSIMEVIEPEHQAKVAEVIRISQPGISRQLELTFRRKDGRIVWALVEGTPVHDAEGRFDGALAMITDITARKRTEDALAHSEEKLRQAQKMEAIGRLAGGVAHDFNNLLSVILSYTSLALGQLKSGDPMRDDLDEVLKAGNRATELTRQLLAFSRRQVLEPRVFDLNESLLGMQRMLARVVGEDVELRLALDPAKALIDADPGQIEQVIMNLVCNARDAMPDGGTLTIETAQVEGRRVRMSFSDTGVGMTEEVMARIFEPFFTTKSKDKGTGLGLAMVIGIVEQSGGQVAVSSELGRGSRFELTLPRAVSDRTVHMPSVGPARSMRGTETILLVEDEEPVRVLAASLLRRSGYHVLEAASSGDALLVAEKHGRPIDLLLTDVVMPRLSGPQLAARIKHARPDVEVLYISGYPGEAITQHGVLDPDVYFLQKPLRPEPFLRKVREVLDSAA